MLFAVIYLLLSFIDLFLAFQFPAFNGINQNSKVGNILDFQEGKTRRSFHSNEVVDCHLENIINIISLEDLQILIEGLASRTAVSPFHILMKLHRRLLNRDGGHEVLLISLLTIPIIMLSEIIV